MLLVGARMQLLLQSAENRIPPFLLLDSVIVYGLNRYMRRRRTDYAQ